MNRREILRALGIAGVASVIPFKKSRSAASVINELNKTMIPDGVSCILIPQETAGPYPFDLSGNAAMFRQDITEGNPGTPLNLTLTIVNVNNSCSPITNARVDIWHCNKDGYYSEF